MKKMKLVLGIIIVVFSLKTYSQQDAQYTQYMYNMNILNPAYAGSKGVTSIGLLGRSQWVGVEGAPKTLTLNLHSPIGKAIGLGLSVINDEIGPVKENNVYADFSYTVFTSEKGRLAFGIKAGISFLDVNSLITIDPDPLNLPIHKTSPNFGAGIYYYTDKFYVGGSVPNILETRYLNRKNGVVNTASYKMHYFLTTGYVFQLSDNLKFKPSGMLKATEGAPISVDLSGNFLINDKLDLGMSYRFDDSISAIIGFNVNDDFRIGYAYDFTTSNYGNFNSGSHELMLLYDFNRRNLKSPRFF